MYLIYLVKLFMNRHTFNLDRIKQIEAKFHATSVSDRTIQYKGEFEVYIIS